MRILYGAATGDGAAGDSADGRAPASRAWMLSEVQLATELLNAYKRRNPSMVFNALRPAAARKGRHGRFVRLRPRPVQHPQGEDRDHRALRRARRDRSVVGHRSGDEGEPSARPVEDIGVSGEVSFTATGGALAPQVPIAIQIADRDSFGRLRWSRDEGPRNLTPYPITAPLPARAMHRSAHQPADPLYLVARQRRGAADGARARGMPRAFPPGSTPRRSGSGSTTTSSQNCDACDKAGARRHHGRRDVRRGRTDHVPHHHAAGRRRRLRDLARRSDRSSSTRRTARCCAKTLVLKADNQDFTLQPIYNAGAPAGEPLFEYRSTWRCRTARFTRGTTLDSRPTGSACSSAGRSSNSRSATLPGEVTAMMIPLRCAIARRSRVAATPALAGPDLRQARSAGPLIVYPDDARRTSSTSRRGIWRSPGERRRARRASAARALHRLRGDRRSRHGRGAQHLHACASS